MPEYVLGGNVFPPMVTASVTSTYAASLPAGTLASALDPALRTGYVSQWNVSFQKGLGRNDAIELAYLGSSGRRLLYYTDKSQCRPNVDLYCNPASKPWPRYDLLVWLESSSNSSYQGLIAKYNHRTEGALNLRFDYTFAKTLTDAWQSTQAPGNQISSCRHCDRGPATYDIRHRAVASIVWEMPFGRGRPYAQNVLRALDMVIGGWSLSGILTFASGQPIYLTAPNQTGGYLNAPLPNRVCDGRDDQLSGNIRRNGFLWMDASCFTVPPVGYFGNAGRTVISGPGLNNWDLGAEKSFSPARGRIRLQVRVEMFNVFNHTQFQQPNGDAGARNNFGRISAARAPRLAQIGLKLLW